MSTARWIFLVCATTGVIVWTIVIPLLVALVAIVAIDWLFRKTDRLLGRQTRRSRQRMVVTRHHHRGFR